MKKEIIIAILIALIAIPLISAAEVSSQKVCVHYFYRDGCHFCAQATPYIESLEKNYSIIIYKHNVQNAADYKIYDELCGMENIPIKDRGVPLVAVGDKIFMGLDQIQQNLEPEIKKLQNSSDYKCILEKYCTQVNQSEQSEPVINISKVTFPVITAAAAADSINPCAIGVLIFLISFLFISSNQSKKRTLIISAIYIIAVYITYTLAGIGILEFLSKVSFLSTITKIFAILILIFGAINIRDSLMKKGTLVIPAKTKPWIEKWVYKASIPAAIILGIIVSAVELPCTGGMYMAILALLANTTTKTQAFWYLLYYNVIFVLPLVIVTLLFIKGIEGHKIHEWMEKHKHKTRLIVGLILVVMGLLLLFL